MEAVARAVAMYLALLLLFRLTGKRSLSQVTTFDFVILLVVGEATAQALLGENFSLTHAVLVIGTLLAVERLFDYLSWRYGWFRRAAESVPMVLVDDGVPVEKMLRRHRLSLDEVMTAGRENHGLERLDQIRWAVLETSGGISVVPWAQGGGPDVPENEGSERG